jgi:segregation and condensation protein A
MSLSDAHDDAPNGAAHAAASGSASEALHPGDVAATPVDAGDAVHLAHAGDYAVKLPVFEGPLDLLLHLIRQNEVEITDIPIASVAKQYLAYIELMHELNLDVAAEYLVMAATLALIKSRMLLPPDENDEEEEAIDPRTELVMRLLEYQRFKEVAEALSHKRLLGRDVFEAQGPAPEAVPDSERELEVGIFELIAAFKQVLDRSDDEPYKHEVETEVVTVRDRMIDVMHQLGRVESIEFMDLFGAEGRRTSRPMLVATFLALLELARLHALHVYQGANDTGAPAGPIRVKAVPQDPDLPSWDERITDTM